MSEYAPPQPSNLPKASVYKIADSVAKQLGYEYDGDVQSIISKLGGKIQYKDFWNLPTKESGSMRVESENNFIIFVPKDTHFLRDNFTIAHELGHYILHYLWPKKTLGKTIGPIQANRYGSDRAEWEANWFAAAFLMPENHFREKFHEFSGNIGMLAKAFGVSAAAAKTRAGALNLL